MKRGSYLERAKQRRVALHSALDIVRENQAVLGSDGSEILLREITAAYLTGAIMEAANRYLGPDAILNLDDPFLGNSHRERR